MIGLRFGDEQCAIEIRIAFAKGCGKQGRFELNPSRLPDNDDFKILQNKPHVLHQC